MDPIAFTIGPLEIRWYGLLMALAFLCGYFILRKLARGSGIKEELTDTYFIYIFLGIIIGARLGEVLFYQPAYYLSDPVKIFYIWQGGLASHGAFIGGIIATFIFCRRHRISFYRIADIAVIPIALGSVFVRIGNFINGEIVGRVTDLPWAVRFENYDSKLRHPAQIYEAVMNLAVFGILLAIRKSRKLPEGLLFWSFVLIYSFLRFFIEFFKEFQTLDSSYALTMGQFLCMVFFLAAAIMMAAGYRGFFEKIYKQKIKSQ
ncbi:MAG: prolipoprotein diacylglyceryl transferase [Candidatus Woesearchaeota archaeon]